MKLGRALIALGVVLVALDIASPIGLVIAGYWDHTYVETYRGYDIYYFPNIGVYGVDALGTNPPLDDPSWKVVGFYGGTESARAAIDNRLDSPIFVESYNGYDIYREPAGAQRYYGVDQETGEETSYWTDLAGLKRYIDGPQGHFAINGQRADTEGAMMVSSTSITVTFTCTDKPDLVKQVYVTVQEVGGTYSVEVVLKKVDRTDVDKWRATVTLPGDGTYRIEGYMDRYLETVRLLSISMSLGSGAPSLPLLTYAGAALATAGLVLEVRERKRN